VARFGPYDVDWALYAAPSEKPTAAEVWHGAIMIESGQDTDVDDAPIACVRLAGGTYAWVTLSTPNAAGVTAEIAAAVPDNINALRVDEARTATAAPGGTTGVISTGTDFVVVTSDNADKVITLPAPTPGVRVAIANGATGYELRSSDPETVAINGGTAAGAESAISANTLVVCTCRSATAWLCLSTATDGSVAATQVAA
jgi:hypothetical protein